MTQILHLRTDTSDFALHDPFPIITAGTDGSISFWHLDISSPVANRADNVTITPTRPQHSVKIHQNAIICAQLVDCSHPLQHDKVQGYLLITGGDDNAFAFTRFSSWSHTSSPHSPVHTSTLLLPRSHTAAIRAIAIKSRCIVKSVLELKVVTASNDQRLKTWLVRFDMTKDGVEGLSVVKGGNVYTAVADIAGVDVLEGQGRKRGDEDQNGMARVAEETGGESEGRGGEGSRVRVVVCGVGMDIRG